MIKIEMAGITVALDNKYEYIEKLCHGYHASGAADITVSATDAEISEQSEKLAVSLGYAESVVLYSKIADELYRYGALLAHGVALEYGGEVYLICAKSGVGKSTHAALWRAAFGDKVSILNGDKPIIRKIGGGYYAAGTPWRGKEREGRAGMVKISALCHLERAAENSAEKLNTSDAAKLLISQIYMPKSPSAMIETLSLADGMVKALPSVKLRVNMDISAATVAHDFIAQIIKN